MGRATGSARAISTEPIRIRLGKWRLAKVAGQAVKDWLEKGRLAKMAGQLRRSAKLVEQVVDTDPGDKIPLEKMLRQVLFGSSDEEDIQM